LHVDSKPSGFVAEREVVEALAQRATPLVCDESCVLFHQDAPPDALYILHEGKATLTMKSQDGKPIMTIETAAGSLLGLPGMIGDQPYTLTATVQAGARVSYIRRAEFTELMQSDPKLSLKILQVMAAEVRSARARVLNTYAGRPSGH
jgi:CRP-like cAMP-binding protein